VTAFALSVLWTFATYASMGPCAQDVEGFLTCGSGDAAARVIVKTISLSKRLAFAWRLTNRPPDSTPTANDPDLENVILRLADGTIIAKSHGAYWDLSTKIAKAYLFAAWSPNSQFLLKIEQRDYYAIAELFSFADDDAALGPIDLTKIIQSTMLKKLQNDPGLSRDLDRYGLIYPTYPEPTVEDQGLIHVVVETIMPNDTRGPTYDVTLQVVRGTRSLDAEIVSILPHKGRTLSITVH
jgi:hypothetical protein